MEHIKVFKQPFLSSLSFGRVVDLCAGLLMYSISFLMLSKFIISFNTDRLVQQLLVLFFFSLIPFGIGYLLTFNLYNYLIITHDHIIVKNILLPFLVKKVKLKELDKVRIWMPYPNNIASNTIEFIKIGKRHGNILWCLECINKNEFTEIRNTISEMGADTQIICNANWKTAYKIQKGK